MAGWSVGWLARWLVAVSKGILKESYTNPYEVQPAIRIRKESYTIRTDSRLPTGLASLAASLAGVGGVVCIFDFLILLIFYIVLIIRAMFWGSLGVVFSFAFVII